LRKFDDGRISLRQRRFAQIELWRKAFDGTPDHPVGVLRVDFTVDLNSQLRERSLSREGMSDVAECIFMLVQQTIFGNIGAPSHNVLTVVITRRQAQYLRHSCRRRLVGINGRVGDSNSH
jgi:hypothetical protein